MTPVQKPVRIGTGCLVLYFFIHAYSNRGTFSDQLPIHIGFFISRNIMSRKSRANFIG